MHLYLDKETYSVLRHHRFRTYAKFSEKVTFLTRACPYQEVRNVNFSEKFWLCTRWMIPQAKSSATDKYFWLLSLTGLDVWWGSEYAFLLYHRFFLSFDVLRTLATEQFFHWIRTKRFASVWNFYVLDVSALVAGYVWPQCTKYNLNVRAIFWTIDGTLKLYCNQF